MTVPKSSQSDHLDFASSALSFDEIQNVGHCLSFSASQMPKSIAVACPVDRFSAKARDLALRCVSIFSQSSPHHAKTSYQTISFRELEEKSNRIANSIVSAGITQGTRLALMIPPGIEFVTWVFGMFKAGIVVVLIDPGMGRKNMVQCLADAEPEGIVGIPIAHLMRTLFRKKFPRCRWNVSVGFFPGCQSAKRLAAFDSSSVPQTNINRESPAAVIFTTGSTGPPKGVLYRHRTFIEQAKQVRNYFDIKPGTVDVSGFPLFALFNAAMGATTVFPKMDATRPAEVHPPEIIGAIEKFQANQSFGSPALWNTMTRYCLKHSIRLPSIKRVLSAGAPVQADLLDRIKRIIAVDGEAFTPYGATESLPVACIGATEVLNETGSQSKVGAGTCVGRSFPDIRWRVIKIDDAPLKQISECVELQQGDIGELIVQGPVVTDQYVTRLEANADHKIQDGNGFWHRMGDVGYLDERGRFWFCGRKSHRLTTKQGEMFTIPCEAIFNNHPKIYRTALVGVGEANAQIPVIVAEPFPEHWTDEESSQIALKLELLEIGSQNPLTQRIEHVLLHPKLPVDIRHNSKIFREKLRPWAATELGIR